MQHTRWLNARGLMGVLLALCAFGAVATTVGDATSLLAKRSEFHAQLQAKALGEPLHLISQDSGSRLQADVYTELALPFAQVSGLLAATDSLCDVMFLHLNVRACVPVHTANGNGLTLTAGPKQSVTGGTIYSMKYVMQVEAVGADYQRVTLSADSGPLSTSDYRIVFEVTPLDAQHSFLHFGYGYSYGTMAKMALSVYLATAGRSKIGFTTVDAGSDGKPHYVQGERGTIERNVMRNYLALLAYTSVPGGASATAMDARLRNWFALSERHAMQLHELTLDEYLAQKHEDLAHMASASR
jgi:hypothetical protein